MKIMSVAAICGWVLSGLLAVLLIGLSAGAKLTEWEGKAQMFESQGFTVTQMYWIGIVEIVITILFLIPRTSFLGGLLLNAYLGGAVLAHVRMNENFAMPIIIGVLVWISLGLRRPEIFRMALGQRLGPVSKTTA